MTGLITTYPPTRLKRIAISRAEGTRQNGSVIYTADGVICQEGGEVEAEVKAEVEVEVEAYRACSHTAPASWLSAAYSAANLQHTLESITHTPD